MDSDSLSGERLREVPIFLWSQYHTDTGLMKPAQPVKVGLRPGTKSPCKNHYPQKEEAIQGIEPQIEGLLKAEVLNITESSK